MCRAPLERAAVVGVRGQPGQGRQPAAVGRAQLGQGRQQRPADHRADPRDAPQQLVLLPPRRAGPHRLDRAGGRRRPASASSQARCRSIPARTAASAAGGQAVGLHHPHLDQLAAPRQQGVERPLLGRRGRPGLGADRLGEVGQGLGVDPVGLGQPAGRLGEVAGLAGVDGGGRDAGDLQGGQGRGLVPAGGLQDDQGRGQRPRAARPARRGRPGRWRRGRSRRRGGRPRRGGPWRRRCRRRSWAAAMGSRVIPRRHLPSHGFSPDCRMKIFL